MRSWSFDIYMSRRYGQNSLGIRPVIRNVILDLCSDRWFLLVLFVVCFIFTDHDECQGHKVALVMSLLISGL